MNRTRLWRTATAGLAAAALLTMSAGVASAQLPSSPDEFQDFLENLDPSQLEELLDELGLPEGTPLDEVLDALQGDDADGDDADGDDADGARTTGEIPETGLGGFSGYAEAEGVIAFVGLPAALAEGLDPILQGLGIAGTSPLDGDETTGLRIDLGRVQADLERAAAGEDISSEASAFVTNLILASADLDEPGACQGGPIEVAVPEDMPFLTFTLAGVDCEETDERAFADVQIAGLGIFLGNLIAQGDEDGQLAGGIQEAIDAINENVLANANELLCPIGEGLLGGGAIANCDADEPILQLANPLDIDIPLIDLDLVQATAEVTQDGDSVTATATSSVAGLNLIGVGCVDQVHTSTATSDGVTATRDASVTSLDGSTCNTDQTLFRLLLGDGPLGDVGLFDAILQDDALDGALEPLFEGLDELLDGLSTAALTGGNANLGPIEGAGTTASTSPFVVAQTIPFDAIEPLEALGEIRVVVAGGTTAVGVNALPAGVEPPAPPAPPAQPVTPAGPGDPAPPTNLPRTGAGAGALLGLAALGAAAALRRRNG